MKMSIYDTVMYSKDNIAKELENILSSYLEPLDGYWLYAEPFLGNDFKSQPTYTILTKELGLIFLKTFDYSEENFSIIDERTWNILGKSTYSEIMIFRRFINQIRSKITDPIKEFETIPDLKVLYYFGNMLRNDHQFSLRDFEQVIFLNEEINLPPLNQTLSENDYQLLVGIIQHNEILKSNNENIYALQPTNIGEAIKANNSKISVFDNEQMRASLTLTNEPERIRGLAGTGKTVLLAIKAARLHLKFPDKKIAFVFFTKSLYVQTRNLIRRYYLSLAENEPNWENLMVLHSWGGVTTGDGFYSYICRQNGIKAKSFNQGGSFDIVCNDLLDKDLNKIFDIVIIDEGQDFPLTFYKLVYKTLTDFRKVIVAYDELQSTNDVKIPNFEDLFGQTNDEVSKLSLKPENDYILKISYRNTLEVLVAAVSFGFGFYSDILTQIIQNSSTWDAFGFKCEGQFREGSMIIVERPQYNSPNRIEELFKHEPITIFYNNKSTELVDMICQEIYNLIFNHQVVPNDIMVIDIGLNKSRILNLIQLKLEGMNIDSIIPGIVEDSRVFFVDNKVTLSTPRNAKGNEVSIVFVVGVEEIYSKVTLKEQRRIRNFLFIAMTRAKAWLYLSVFGKVKTRFDNEYKQIKKNSPRIIYRYPSENVISELNKIDFVFNNPRARKVDETLDNLKNVIERDREMVLQLLKMDPKTRELLKDLVGE